MSYLPMYITFLEVSFSSFLFLFASSASFLRPFSFDFPFLSPFLYFLIISLYLNLISNILFLCLNRHGAIDASIFFFL
jgi:hypothetical protein